MIRIITLDDGRRYRCEGRNRQAMLNEINMARATGSIGGSSYEVEFRTGKERLIAKVVQINSDYSERRPYTKAF